MAALGSNMKGRSKKTEANKEKKETLVKKLSKPRKEQKLAAKPKKAVKTKPIAKAKAPAKPKTEKKVELQESRLKNAALILEPSRRKKIRKTKVYLEGELNINNVEAFMIEITPIFNDYDYVDFFLRNVTYLDLCYIQMLYHFQASYSKKKKFVTIDSDISAEVKKVVVHAGFEELMFIPKLV